MRTFLLLSFALFPAGLACQQREDPPAARQAAETITEADIRSRIFVIAHDSMAGRSTPSPGLDKTAAYIAAEFRRFGLKPGGDSGTFIQRYSIKRSAVDTAGSGVSIEGPDSRVTLSLSRDAALYSGPMKSGSWPVVLLGGPLDSANPASGAFRGKAVIWYPEVGTGLGQLRQGLRHVTRGGAEAVLVSIPDDSLMNRPLQSQLAGRMTVGMSSRGTTWILARESAVLAQAPQAAQHIAQMRKSPAYAAEPVEGFSLRLTLREQVLAEVRAPNTVGILEGSDPRLRNEYIVFSAHMDHVGVGSSQTAGSAAAADTIFNGADDDASGTVGIVELAEAFTRPGARPRRSLIFLTVSGEERGLWGSDYFGGNPPVPIAQIVANLNADMIGRNWKDTIVVIGKEHSDLGATLHQVTARHPELGMTPIDDLWPEQSFYTRSDHFNFAKRGVPVLFFFNGTHADYHRVTDHPDKIDAEKTARIVRLMYWLARDIGNAPERPAWNPDSYQRFVTEKP